MCMNEYGSLSSSNAPMPKTKYTYNVKLYAKFAFLTKSTNIEIRCRNYQSQQVFRFIILQFL